MTKFEEAIQPISKKDEDFTIPLGEHNGTTLRNLVNLIYSRGALIGKATGGTFGAEERLVEVLKDDACTYSKINFFSMLADFEYKNGKSLHGVEITNEEIHFTGFEKAADMEHRKAYIHLAVLMNRQALRQKRVLAKKPDDKDEKYAMRIWLCRIGMSGPEFKKDRAILLEKLGENKNFPETENIAARKTNVKTVRGFQQNALYSSQCAVVPHLQQPETISDTTFRDKNLRESGEKNGKLKVAAYIRVSTDMSDQENSYEAQAEYFHQLLSRNEKWISAGIYSDYGISGTSRRNRIGFKRILRHCSEGRIDRIVTKSISRFARNTVDFMTALNTLQEAGVTIFFEKEGLDTAEAASSFVLTTLAAIAQEESRSISANLIWGNRKRFQRGDVRNQDIYGYHFTNEHVMTESGYHYKDVAIVEEEAEIVRWIFKSYVEGRAFKDMARDLNRRCIPYKPSPYTKKRMKGAAKGQLNADIEEGWTSEQINSILKNERYTGNVLVQKTYTEDYLTHKIRVNKGEAAQYLVKDHHPVIVSQDLFEQAREKREILLAAKSHGGTRTPYAFSGRLICGKCGRFYNIRNVKKHPIWFCPSTIRNNGKTICCNEKVYEEQIVRMFRKAIAERFQLIAVPIADHVEDDDILSGTFKGGECAPFSRNASGFIRQMLTSLENIQRMDFMERDRAFMKRKITAAAEAQEKALKEQLEYLEKYWEELEADYECREKAIQWMKSLPEGKEGLVQFLNDIKDTYVKAFVLSITIHNPLHYTVQWFDDTRTDVEMYTNIKDHRCTAPYLDEHIMKEKK